MIGKYKKLKQDFENLEKEYSREVAKNLDLQYEYDNLKADYTNETIQRAEIERLHENTRRLKHDMKNHIMVSVSYINNGEIEQAKNYLSDVLDNLNKTYSYIQTGNSVMNYIINSKLEKAHSKGIGFKAEIENLPFEKMGSVDFLHYFQIYLIMPLKQVKRLPISLSMLRFSKSVLMIQFS